MRAPARTAAVVTAALLALLTACGSDDGDDPSGSDDPATTESSTAAESTAPTDPGTSGSTDPGEDVTDDATSDAPGDTTAVTRGRFCPDVDTADIGRTLGIDDVVVIADLSPDQADAEAPGTPSWSCTVGQTTGDTVAVTFTVYDNDATSADLDGTLQSRSAALEGNGNCRPSKDTALGAGTEGLDCSLAAQGDGPAASGFAAVVRANLVGNTLLECFLASIDAADLRDFTAAAPRLCGGFLDLVSG